MDFESYKNWSKAQPCVDCRKIKDGKGLWATEVQCYECWKKYGAPEKRGLPSARDVAEKNGVHV